MADGTGIGWTEATWNPTTGCDRVSPGCAKCYALTLAARLKKMGVPAYQRDGDPRTSGPGFGLTLHPDRLDQPHRWKRPRMIFVNSMSDLFHEDVPPWFIGEVFRVMRDCPQHTFQILTKRPERMASVMSMVPIRFLLPMPNVWLGVSIENGRFAYRADVLREIPAVVHFISAEPLLGSLAGSPSLDDIEWVIAGGESGPRYRPLNLEHVRELRDACDVAGVPFFLKQIGGSRPKAGGKALDGVEHCEFPVAA